MKGDKGNLNNEELNNLNSSPNIVMAIKSIGIMWAGHIIHMEDRSKILIRKLERKKLFEGHRQRHKENVQRHILLNFYLILIAACCLLDLTIITILAKEYE